MTLTRISVVTVSMNDAEGLERTIESLASQDYANLQYIVVDGGSTDGSRELFERNEECIDLFVSEPDLGIYHAMNKALDLADGEWIIYMNAGDVFSSPSILSAAAGCIEADTDVVYSDWSYRESGKRVRASLEPMNVRHQSVIYRKSLHAIYGSYVVGERVTISDFVFFLSLTRCKWLYFERPLSICDQDGVSANPAHFYQRIATEFIFGRRGRFYTSAILVLYPIYRFIKRKLLRIS